MGPWAASGFRVYSPVLILAFKACEVAARALSWGIRIFWGFCKPVAPFESGKQSLLLRVYGLPPVYTTKVWDVSSHSFRFSGFGLALFFFGFAAHFVRSF